MYMGLIEPDGQPSELLESMVEGMVKGLLDGRKKVSSPPDFFVCAVQDKDGKTSYWGVIDLAETPEEDVYIQVQWRFYCAARTLGQKNIRGFGFVDVQSMLDRVPIPIIQA